MLHTRYILTYHKCGSNWFRNVFREIAARHGANWLVTPYSQAKVNEPVDRGADDAIAVIRGGGPAALEEAGYAKGQAALRCVRDPRDALISQYWSWKNSHHNNTPEILEARALFESMPRDEALLWIVENNKLIMARQITALGAAPRQGMRDLKYESLLADFHDALSPALTHLTLPTEHAELEKIREACSFEAKTRRKPGEVDAQHHLRRGQAGEWREVFSDRLTGAFKDAYGDLVLALGYETNAGW